MSARPAIAVRALRAGEAHVPDSILRALPDWFGIEEATRMYAEETMRLPAWVGEVGGAPAGFISIKRHFPETADIFVIAVRPEHHRHGVGRALVEHASAWARGEGCRALMVKTMGPSKPNAEYAATLRFYLGMGFARLEEFQGVWRGIPCLVLARVLNA